VDNRKRDLLDQANWDEIIPQLLKYALSKLRRLDINVSSPLSGLDLNQVAEEQVMEAIRKVWDETVTWDYEKKDDLLLFLKGVVKSQVSHLCDNEEYLKTKRFPIAAEMSDGDPIEVEEILDKANPHEKHAEVMATAPLPNPDEILSEKERGMQDKAAMDALLGRLNGDKELEDAVMCIMAGLTTPREIAKEMGVETKHVNNLQKRLRRIYKDLHEQDRKERRQ
jgi:DNA-directed RNA polymerase specialized sigma24 family protein